MGGGGECLPFPDGVLDVGDGGGGDEQAVRAQREGGRQFRGPVVAEREQ